MIGKDCFLEDDELIERLADCAHVAWSGWMKYMFSKMHDDCEGGLRLPGEFVDRWVRQMNTPYAGLPEIEKESDRVEAKKIIEIITFNG